MSVVFKEQVVSDNAFITSVEEQAMRFLCIKQNWPIPQAFRLYPEVNSKAVLIHWKVQLFLREHLKTIQLITFMNSGRAWYSELGLDMPQKYSPPVENIVIDLTAEEKVSSQQPVTRNVENQSRRSQHANDVLDRPSKDRFNGRGSAYHDRTSSENWRRSEHDSKFSAKDDRYQDERYLDGGWRSSSRERAWNRQNAVSERHSEDRWRSPGHSPRRSDGNERISRERSRDTRRSPGRRSPDDYSPRSRDSTPDRGGPKRRRRRRRKGTSLCPVEGCNQCSRHIREHIYEEHIPRLFDISRAPRSEARDEYLQRRRAAGLRTLALWVNGLESLNDLVHMVNTVGQSKCCIKTDSVSAEEHKSMRRLCLHEGWEVKRQFLTFPVLNSPAALMHWRVLMFLMGLITQEQRMSFMYSGADEEF